MENFLSTRQVVHFGAEKMNLLLCSFASTSHRLKVFEGEFPALRGFEYERVRTGKLDLL
jgi:hypothetical protein